MITIRTPLAARSLSGNHAEGVVCTPVAARALTYVGGMAGWIDKGEPSRYVGGMAGWIDKGEPSRYVGGMAGWIDKGEPSRYVGGMAGWVSCQAAASAAPEPRAASAAPEPRYALAG